MLKTNNHYLCVTYIFTIVIFLKRVFKSLESIYGENELENYLLQEYN